MGSQADLTIDDSIVVEPRSHEGTPPLRAGLATIIVLAFVAAHFITGVVVRIVVGIVAGFLAACNGDNLQSPDTIAQITDAVTPAAAVLGPAVAGIAIVIISVQLLRDRLRDRSPNGAAWVLGSSSHILIGLAVGLVSGIFYLSLAGIIAPQDGKMTVSPVLKMAVTPGLPQLLWFTLALFLAPAFEELLFRGVFYGGYRASFGPMWAAIVTTAVFVLLHITAIMHSWPSVVGITVMAIAALCVRLRAGAVGPAVSVHFAYNAVMVLAVVYSAM